MTGGVKYCPVVGLLGGVGAGKSAVAGIFGELGAVIIDADNIARQVLLRPEIIARIAAEFGEGVLQDGLISRSALADAVFHDASLVRKLNAIVHPAVIHESRRVIDQARRDGCRAVILDAPLIVEAGLEGLCDYLVYVDAPEDLRTRRLAESRGWQPLELVRREKFQESLDYKRKRADYTVDNSGDRCQTTAQVAVIWKAIVGN